jgi:hypothetical protein
MEIKKRECSAPSGLCSEKRTAKNHDANWFQKCHARRLADVMPRLTCGAAIAREASIYQGSRTIARFNRIFRALRKNLQRELNWTIMSTFLALLCARMCFIIGFLQPLDSDVRVDLRGRKTRVAKQRLHAAQVRASVKQVRGEGMAKFVRAE